VALFAAKIPGGLALLWPLVVVSLIIACGASVAFAGNEARPAISLMIGGGAWVLLATTCSYLLALSVASLTGSRASAIGQVFAWQFIVSAMLLHITGLGVARQALQMTALNRLIPAGLQDSPPDPVIGTMSIGLAFLVVAAWAAIPLAAAAWRTRTRDA
jgi:ABC-type transport system involved in multi-copper enzyme maturation permease subunit